MLQPQQLDDVAHRYTGEVAELRSFLAKAGIALDAPDSLREVTERLTHDRAFRRDLTSHVWVVLHAAVPPAGYAEMLAMLAVATAGTHYAAAAGEAEAHSLLRFIMQAKESFGTTPQAGALASPQAPTLVPPADVLRPWPVAPMPPTYATAQPDAQTLFLQSSAALQPEAEPWQRRPIVWAGAAACLLLLLLVVFWPRSHMAPAPIVATIPTPPARTDTLPQPLPVPKPTAGQPAPATRRASAAPRASRRSHTLTARNAPADVFGAPTSGSSLATPASAESSPARSRTARRLSAATAPATAKSRSGVPAVTAVDLGNPTAPRSNTNARTGGSKDTVIATLGTPIVRPTSLGIMASHVVYFPSPAYPEQASADHIQGEVKIEAEVDRNGNVISTRVISGPEQLRAATEDAVQHWHYRPYMYDGKPIAMNAEVVVDYQLP